MKKILIVDDSKTARMMLKHWLTALRPDATILEADGADQALAHMKQPEGEWMAFIDYNMEGLNGMELVEALMPFIPATRMALVTANFQAAVQDRAHGKGIRFMKKPMNPKKVQMLLNQMEQAEVQ
ncbi:response regulator transcription factor [Acanthopleuribacter pedis]|uniref:Response regulator n=1 Tax=Acanthopleuribacter pedis TaxID=442870 RepID=A0A8J7U6H2_9BACT|nr:response regulator [Acanthopleuribacter pedis]MBO1320361.1 response regulator [Acanthopleuribacter pedis]